MHLPSKYRVAAIAVSVVEIDMIGVLAVCRRIVRKGMRLLQVALLVLNTIYVHSLLQAKSTLRQPEAVST